MCIIFYIYTKSKFMHCFHFRSNALALFRLHALAFCLSTTGYHDLCHCVLYKFSMTQPPDNTCMIPPDGNTQILMILCRFLSYLHRVYPLCIEILRENRVLLDTFHINKLKLEFVSTTSGTVNTQGQLSKAIQDTNNIENTATNKKCIYQWDEITSLQSSIHCLSQAYYFTQ